MITYQVKGNDCFVDDCDSDLLQYTYDVMKSSSKKHRNAFYLRRTKYINNKRYRHYIHREIMARIVERSLLRSEEVDHEDGNGFNNTRANLRIATHSQNGANKGLISSNKSGYKGVSWDKERGKFFSKITVNKKQIPLGRYDTAEQANAAYVAAAKKYFGEFNHK